jgi:hypothetical protein
VLALDTCASFPSATLNTTLFLGTGCPATNASWPGFACRAANEDAHCPGSFAKPGLSMITHTVAAATAARYYYVLAATPTGFAFSLGQGVRLNVTVLLPPSPSITPSSSATPSSTFTPDPACAGEVAFTAQLAGSSGNYTGTILPDELGGNWYIDPDAWPQENTYCEGPDGSESYPTGMAQVFSLDVRPIDGSDYTPGGVVELSTCGSESLAAGMPRDAEG